MQGIGPYSRFRHAARSIVGLLAAVVSLFAACATVAATPAGTDIVNVAGVDFSIDGTAAHIVSNEVRTITGEIIDIALTPAAEGPVTLSDRAGDQVVGYMLQNMGTGNEAFVVTLRSTFPQFHSRIAVDRNGDGRFDPAVDTVLPDDGRTPPLRPAESMPLLAVMSASGGDGQGMLMVQAHAVTGSGTPGTTFEGQGDGGGDAVVGQAHAEAELSVPMTIVPPELSLAKSQSVSAPDGSDRPVRGAIVRYRLEAALAAGSAGNVRIVDPVPDGTDYVPGSLTLDGAALSDAADDDAGALQNQAVTVALGDLVAPATRAVTFQVRIR